MKKRLWITIILSLVLTIAIPYIFIYYLNNGNPYTKYLANRNVPTHLEKQGYTDSDLEASHYVEAKHTINSDYYHGHYMVIFKDEPEVTYYYGVAKKGKAVKQFCEKDILSSDGVTDTSEKKTKHSEEDCDKSL